MKTETEFVYVGVLLEDAKIKLVTHVEDGNIARWENGYYAYEFSKESYANSVAGGLNLNFIPAVVVKSFYRLKNEGVRDEN